MRFLCIPYEFYNRFYQSVSSYPVKKVASYDYSYRPMDDLPIRIFHTLPTTTHKQTHPITRFLLRDLLKHRTIRFVDDTSYDLCIIFHDRIDIAPPEPKKLVKNLARNNHRIKANSVKILVNPLSPDELCPNLLCDLAPDIVVGNTNPTRYPSAVSVECPPWFYLYYDVLCWEEPADCINRRIHNINPERAFTTLVSSEGGSTSSGIDAVSAMTQRYFPTVTIPSRLGSNSLAEIYQQLKDHVFVLCSDTTTLFLAMYSGCIPIYVGHKHSRQFGELESQLFHTQRILFTNRHTTPFLEQLLRIYRQWLVVAVEHIKQPAFRVDALPHLKKHYDTVAQQIAVAVFTKMAANNHQETYTKDNEANTTMMELPRKPRIFDIIVAGDMRTVQECVQSMNDWVNFFIVFGMRRPSLAYKRTILWVDVPMFDDTLPEPLNGWNQPVAEVFPRIALSEFIKNSADIGDDDIILYSDTPASRIAGRFLEKLPDIVRVCGTPVGFMSPNDNDNTNDPATIAFRKSELYANSPYGDINTLWNRRGEYVRFPFV